MSTTEKPELTPTIIEKIAELKSKYDILSEDIILLHKQKRIIDSRIYSQEKELKELKKQINEYENCILQETIIDDNIRSKPGFHLLTINEINAIVKGIDKTDYSKYGQPRFSDISKVIDNILKVKNLYPTWILEYMRKCGQYDTMPPQNFYEFDFKTQEGLIFSSGSSHSIKLN